MMGLQGLDRRIPPFVMLSPSCSSRLQTVLWTFEDDHSCCGAASALYLGKVVHQRVKPLHHRFAYPVISLLIDLNELSDLNRNLRFSRTTASIYSAFLIVTMARGRLARSARGSNIIWPGLPSITGGDRLRLAMHNPIRA